MAFPPTHTAQGQAAFPFPTSFPPLNHTLHSPHLVLCPVRFYTSRPALKRYVRVLSHWLQAARQLEVFTNGDGSATRSLWEAMGVVQHHDAVSGTERQHVA